MTKLYLDTETYSETPIGNGTHAYAEDSEVMIVSYAFDDEPAASYDCTAEGRVLPPRVEQALDDPDTIIVGHNFAMFDRNVLRHSGIHIPCRRIHDTMIQALAHGLPGGLDKLCGIFNVPIDLAKSKGGRRLIMLFCKPQPKNRKIRRATRATHHEDWIEFLDYARLDIESMRYLYKKMPRWNYPDNPAEFDLYALDQKINDRGIRIDTELVTAAIETVKREKKRLNKLVEEKTDGELQAATQRDALLKRLLEAHGVALPDMQKATIERRIMDPDLPDPVRELLAIRLEESQTSVTKYATLNKAVSDDGRFRGGLQFCGASRTGRWSGRTFQPQNLPRPSRKQGVIEQAIEAVKAGVGDLVLDNATSHLSDAVRGCIIAREECKLVVSDLSNIEGRVIAWLAGEDWKLKAFRDYDRGEGPDLYVLAYSRSFDCPIDRVTPDNRQIGKVQELALGFQGAAGAFGSMAALYGIELPDDEVDTIVKGWRSAHDNVVSLWYGLERAARNALSSPGSSMTYGKIAFEKWRNWLIMHLPSGRRICYASPRIVDHPIFDNSNSLSYMGMNSYTRRWERLHTYGGKLAENATQATARDVMAANMPLAESSGYPIVLTVHDELVTEPLDIDDKSEEELSAILSTTPHWADDRLPIAAGGFETYRYRKD